MPAYWSVKDERMYQHIKKSLMKSGASEEMAEGRAAARVNEQRKKEGRTKEQRSKKNPPRRHRDDPGEDDEF